MSFIDLREKDEREIISEILDLGELEREIYFTTLNSRYTVKELVRETGRSRSVVQRALQSLMEKELVIREGITDKTVYYIYTSIPFEELKEVVRKILRSWHDQVMEKLS